jgi:hypothetical protein
MEEIAVGAPFEDGGRGAVRIFYGKKNVASIQGRKSLYFVYWNYAINILTKIGHKLYCSAIQSK